MIHKQLLIERVIGPDVFCALIETLYNQDTEFQDIYDKYCAFLHSVGDELISDYHTAVPKLKFAIMQRTCSALFYAGCLGFKMNYEHFVDPLTPTCILPCVAFDTYLGTERLRDLPLYRASSEAIAAFKALLNAEQLAQFSAVENLSEYLDVIGPQLAHYYGYLAANSLLEHLVPGYRRDVLLDVEYTRMLEQHLGFKLDHSQWNGVLDLEKWIFPEVDCGDAQSAVFLRNELLFGLPAVTNHI